MCVPVCALKRSSEEFALSPFLCDFTSVRYPAPRPVDDNHDGREAEPVAVTSTSRGAGGDEVRDDEDATHAESLLSSAPTTSAPARYTSVATTKGLPVNVILCARGVRIIDHDVEMAALLC